MPKIRERGRCGPVGVLVLAAASWASAQPADTAENRLLDRSPLSFIENRGQFDPNVKFQARSGGKVVWFTNGGLVFDVLRTVAASELRSDSHSTPEKASGGKFERLVFSEDFTNGNTSSNIEASKVQPGIYNYFIGNDPRNWQTNVVSYSQLLYHDVWPGIDVRFVVKDNDIEQEFVVHPGADASRIQVAYHGVKGLEVAKDGSLVIETLFGRLRESAPSIYSENRDRRTPARGNFKVSEDLAYAFKVGSYSKANTLVIDPTLLFSTYVGGTGTDLGSAIAVDPAGSVYVGGSTLLGSGYPTTLGVLQATCPSASSCSSGVVTKLNALGQLQYSTYLGSSTGGDNVSGIAVDANGEAYATGLAKAGFPTTSSAFQGLCPGSQFMAKLSSTGAALLYSTCFSSGASTFPRAAIAVDMNGRAYVTGTTTSSAFPTTTGAFQTALTGQANAFVSVVDPSLSGTASLAYSTYLGGEVEDFGNAIAVDAYGSAYITGNTLSSRFPVTQNAFQPTDEQGTCVLNSNPYTTSQCSTAFVAKLNPNFTGTSSLIYSSYLGGTASGTGVGDYGYSIAADSVGNAYVGGITNSLNFPTTSGAFQSSTTCSYDGFVTKVNAGGSALVYSTFLTTTGQPGTCFQMYLPSIAVGSSGNVYIAGWTGSPSFPVTVDAFQSIFHSGGGDDGFVAELTASGSTLIYSSYLGGTGDNGAYGIAIDAVGDAYVVGDTASLDFPITPFAFQSVFGGGSYDIFVTKFPLGAPGELSISGILPSSGGNAGTLSSEIIGSGFHGGASVALVFGSTQVLGSSVTVGSEGRTIATSFNLTGVPSGHYDLVITNPDGTMLTLPHGFTILQGGQPQIWVSLSANAHAHVGDETSMGLIYGNSGTIDAVNVPLWVSGFPTNVGLDLGFTVNPPPASIFPPVNWAAFPAVLEPGDQQIATAMPSYVPTGPTGFLPIGLTIPLDGQTVTCKAWASPIYRYFSQNGIQQRALDCLGSFGSDVFNDLTGSFPDGSILQQCEDEERSALVTVAQDKFGELIPTYTDIKAFLVGLVRCLAFKESQLIADGELNAEIDMALEDESFLEDLEDCFGPGSPSTGSTTTVSSYDPNSLTGVLGVGVAQWISARQPLSYSINFGNLPTATAPAQQVVIADQLPLGTDLSTLGLIAISLVGKYLPLPPTVVPALGATSFATSLDLRPNQNLLVNINAQLNINTGLLTWTFSSIDPVTGLPPTDPTIGFLPPGGEGDVLFSVFPHQGITTGATIANTAGIVFDNNPSISTPTWINTIDNTSPVSHVSAVPAASTCPAFRVNWSGSDVGSGLQGFTIFVSDTGGPSTTWLSNTTTVAGDYTGAVGHTYSFYSIATDLTGNIEVGKTSAEASTSVTATGPCGPPSLSGELSNISQSATTVTATLTLTNTGFTAAQALNINQIVVRTLSGSGAVTLATPTLPTAEGPLAIGGSIAVPLTLNVPVTVNRFSLTESGTLQDPLSNSYNFSMAQTVIP